MISLFLSVMNEYFCNFSCVCFHSQKQTIVVQFALHQFADLMMRTAFSF
jgi:hypothetical protein